MFHDSVFAVHWHVAFVHSLKRFTDFLCLVKKLWFQFNVFLNIEFISEISYEKFKFRYERIKSLSYFVSSKSSSSLIKRFSWFSRFLIKWVSWSMFEEIACRQKYHKFSGFLFLFGGHLWVTIRWARCEHHEKAFSIVTFFTNIHIYKYNDGVDDFMNPFENYKPSFVIFFLIRIFLNIYDLNFDPYLKSEIMKMTFKTDSLGWKSLFSVRWFDFFLILNMFQEQQKTIC